MKCQYCGTSFEGKSCPNCGAPAAAEAPAANPTPIHATPAAKAAKPKKPFYKKWWFWAIAVILVIAIAGNAGDDTDTDKPGGSQSGTQISDDNATVSQKNAAKKAKSYLEHLAFSYEGLIKQLEFEQFSHEDAVYGADNCGADWNEQAAKKAKSYLDVMAFSRDGLIDQLEFEGFTHDQAVYGVTANNL